jgi:hypothetical protein
VTEVAVLTTLVLTVKVALVAPALTVTDAGTVAAAVLLLDKITTAPSLGAGALSTMVPVEGLPPLTLDGTTVREETARSGLAVLISSVTELSK